MQRLVYLSVHFFVEKLLFPFKHDLLYFIFLWIILAFPACYQDIEAFPYTIYFALLYYLITYVIVFILNLNRFIGKICKPIIFIIGISYAIINLYCMKTYDCRLSNDIILIIKGTNVNEIQEYIKMYLSWKDLILYLISILICISAYILTIKIKLEKLTWKWIPALTLLLLSIFAMWHNPIYIDKEFGNSNKWMFSSEEIVDLRNHFKHPQIQQTFTVHPTDVVIILGESFAKSHSSLYGYEKKTNPLLEEKHKEGNLIVFNNVISPMTYTTAVFKYLLNTYQLGMEERCKWYETINLIEVLNSVNYYTVWFSNQESKGMYDNLPSGHSKICNEVAFMTKKSNNHKYDGELIRQNISKKKEYNAIIYHLMGQHGAFAERYPIAYNKFKSSDYNRKIGKEQKTMIAEYDNATLYNDFVVNSIIDKYKNNDAIIFYLSDHGLDIFDTDLNYCGHAKHTPKSEQIGKSIPFVVYISPLYQQLRPEITERIKNSVNKDFCTDQLIYAVMDAIGYKFADNDDVKRYSLFSNPNK